MAEFNRRKKKVCMMCTGKTVDYKDPETLRKYITKLENGKFKVRIPLKDEFKNKKLKAYYINDNNKIEEYNINIENGYAIFETDHFSTYTIAESGEISNPSTLDNLNSYIFLGFI